MKTFQHSLMISLIAFSTLGLAACSSMPTPTDQPMQKNSITVPMYTTTAQGSGKFIGDIIISESAYGLLFTPHLTGLSVGAHGFHIHTMPSCSMKGMSAGGHLDPTSTNQHLGPYGSGHLGDLPALYANQNGSATTPLLAPRIKSLSVVKNHALMIHEGGDNYSDKPEKLGGGRGRMICGVIPA